MLGGRRAIGLVHHHVGLGEPRIDIPLVHLDVLQQVAVTMVFVNRGRTRLCCFDGVADHRQLFVIHLDQVQRLGSDLFAVGGHNGHGITAIANLVGAQYRPVRHHQAVQVASGDLGMGQHGVDPRKRLL